MVLGWFWQPDTYQRPSFRGVQTCVLGVLGLASRARIHDIICIRKSTDVFSHARANKPDQPNTPSTLFINSLFLRGFKCVGSVLGRVFFVLGSDFERKGQ